MRIAIVIQTKDRPTELALLLQSLRTQTVQDYDVYILDDASGTPITGYHFLMTIVERMRMEGHRMQLARNHSSKGISSARQQMVEWVLKDSTADYLLRIDDDTICDPDYIEKLVRVIDAGYDIASGVTPPAAACAPKRSIEAVSPIINRIELDEEGRFVINTEGS